VPILQGISREHYAMHSIQLFIDQSSVPHARVDRKSTFFNWWLHFFWRALFSCFGMVLSA